MAIKTIEYKVNIAGITPATEQFGGMQGDHRVTSLSFCLDDYLHDTIEDAAIEAGGRPMYRFDVYDGEGGLWSSDAAELTENVVSFELEERHTRHGGKITVYLVITALSADNETQVELYSFPAVIRLKNRPEGTYQDGENYESVTSLAEVAKSNALDAEKTNKELQAFAAQIEEKLKNGDFDGVGVESAVIINDELIITYTDGTVQNLGNVKGDTGPQGEKGDKGDAGKDAVTDQTYNPESENAQSGVAVAEAVRTCIPRPISQYGAPPPFAITFYDTYFIDENGSPTYLPADAFRSTEIDDGSVYNKESVNNATRWLVARDNRGNLWTGEPVDDQDCVPKQYADKNFLPIQKSNGMTYEVYALSPGGNSKLEVEDNSYFENEGNYGQIPCRQSNGNILTNTPVKDLDCANKKYVDDLVGDIDSALTELRNYAQALIGGNS